MDYLDVNKNGTIEFGEFLHWIARECGLSTNERNKKKKKNDMNERLQNLVMSLRSACKILLTEKRTIENKLLPLENGKIFLFLFLSFLFLFLLSSFFFQPLSHPSVLSLSLLPILFHMCLHTFRSQCNVYQV